MTINRSTIFRTANYLIGTGMTRSDALKAAYAAGFLPQLISSTSR